MGLQPGVTEGIDHGGVPALLVQRVLVVEVQGAGAGLPGDGEQGLGGLAEVVDIPLLHRDIDDFREAPEALLTIARETGASALHFNHEYPLDEQRRDAAVIDAFRGAGLEAHGHHDSVAFAPGELLTGKGEYYGVFTPFAKRWHQQLTAERLALSDTPAPQADTGIASKIGRAHV